MINIASKDTAVALLSLMIGEAVLYFNVGKTMGPAQIKQVVEMLLADPILKNFKPEDYKVLFEDMKKGYYGNLYDRFDGQIIFQNAVKYADKRQSIIETESINRSNELKTKGQGLMNPVIVEALSKIKTEIPIDTPKKTFCEKLVKPAKRELSEKDQFIKECFAAFETEYSNKPVVLENNSSKFIKYKGKPVSEVEFVQAKLKEKYPLIIEE